MRELKQPTGQIISFRGGTILDNSVKRAIEGFVKLAIERGMNLRELKIFLQAQADTVEAKLANKQDE